MEWASHPNEPVLVSIETQPQNHHKTHLFLFTGIFPRALTFTRFK
ncbi:hypothetical protein SAMN04488109_1915 [Chryseolinea serpens]|uniref:Uncharacterized protein n=1 Tax=Chryseolinea serpens TaxID=947013 RepID=A0A1M5MSU3_9BACT|nr:hypothetical protein SAMN04488109_1915 [Chryseolinea serpens]